ncbi:MAG TPA: pseudouridine synthase [Candidatus Limnocylindria bacterium]|jgi:23S rRNA pseudouridine2605 synthase|nr:pseudouridine synthase [Candidatus Limnocylindria bacterium]
MVRLQKFLADAGVASRRAAEAIIAEGRVAVNGQVVTELGTKVNGTTDAVTLDGEPVRVRRKLYVALNKPPGFICTRIDELGRRTVFELLPPDWGNLFPVGRLDRESEGLLFLTNDGDFSLRLTHPRFGVTKKYWAVVAGRLQQRDVSRFTEGVEHEGEVLKAERARVVSSNNSHSVVELELAQGKNREVRRLFEVLGHEVEQLKRVQIGPIKLGELPVGKWRALGEIEIKSLLRRAD